MKTIETSTYGRLRPYLPAIIVVVWASSYLLARGLLDVELNASPVVKWIAVLLPILPTALFLSVVIQALASLDELHRKVHLEALAIAFPAAILLLMVLGLIEVGFGLPKTDLAYRHVWPILPGLYLAALILAWRRYR